MWRIAFALLFAAPAFCQNFAYVQSTTGAFGSNNTAGDVIVVFVHDSVSATVSDTQGNTYQKVQTSPSGSLMVEWAATGIKAGANTVSQSGGSGLWAAEFSSANPVYSVCAAANAPGEIYNSGTCSGCYVPSVNFTSSSEVMAIIFGTLNGTATWTVSAGMVLLGAGGGATYGAGADDVSSMTGAYSLFLYDNGGTTGTRIGGFLSLTGSAGCVSTPSNAKQSFSIIM
jgi:hypothetical protein